MNEKITTYVFFIPSSLTAELDGVTSVPLSFVFVLRFPNLWKYLED